MRLAHGVLVPIPTLPLPRTLKSCAPVVEATLKSDAVPLCCIGEVTVRFDVGVLVPIPMKFVSALTKTVEVPITVLDPEKKANCPADPTALAALVVYSLMTIPPAPPAPPFVAPVFVSPPPPPPPPYAPPALPLTV